jgi:hypothetical protein
MCDHINDNLTIMQRFAATCEVKVRRNVHGGTGVTGHQVGCCSGVAVWCSLKVVAGWS